MKKILKQSTVKTYELGICPYLFWPTVSTIFSHSLYLSSTNLCTPAFSHLLLNLRSWNLIPSETIDRSIVLSRLSYSFGISVCPCFCLVHFLSFWSHPNCLCKWLEISPGSTTIRPSPGTVLGPILFVPYTHPLSKIIQHHSLYYHSFFLMITSSTFLPTPLTFRKSSWLHNCGYLMFRHGCTTINLN